MTLYIINKKIYLIRNPHGCDDQSNPFGQYCEHRYKKKKKKTENLKCFRTKFKN